MVKKELSLKEIYDGMEAIKELLRKSNDGRHDMTNKALDFYKPIMMSQDDFGMDKYNRPLKSEYRYNWGEMGDQEIADFLKYRVCEKERMELVTRFIKEAYESDDVFFKNTLLLEALNLLTIEGTGK